MIQIRKGVFETNSSSTHSIAIPKDCKLVNNVNFYIDEFGWEWREADAADYLYTAIHYIADTESDAQEKIERLKNILDEHGITYHFGHVESHIWHDDYGNKDYRSLDNGYIDHGDELEEFIEELLNDGDKLVRFISGGLVFTGNDNSDAEQSCFVNRTEEYVDDIDWRTNTCNKIKNPYYMSDHNDYEWYYKGN